MSDMPACKCLNCGKILDGATSTTSGKLVSSGDVTICIYCGHLMAFATDLTLRALTDEEIYAVAGDKRILRAQRALAEFKEKS
jgi:DNA-directed RNA polymerase subunit RPC12/RpoP